MAEESTPTKAPASSSSRLNTAVALSVAIIGTVMGVCKVKDDNIVQAMQQAQADKIDHWAYYQARNLREEFARATALQLRLQAASKTGKERADYDAAVAQYEALAADQAVKKDELRKQADADQKNYDALNYRDDQFDLSDAALSIAVAMLAVAAVTDLWWMFFVGLVPAAFGIAMGVAGLAGWALHPQWLTQLLS